MATAEIIDFVLRLKGDLPEDAKKGAEGLDAMSSSSVAAAGAVAAVGAAVLAAGAALFSYVDGISKVVDETNTLGKATGLANETIAGLRAAAVASGKSLNDLVPTDLSKKMLDAANGLTKAQRAFDQLGVSATNVDGSLRNTDTVFREIIDSLGQVEDPTLKSALAMQALGKQGQQLLTAFESSAGLDQFVAQAEKFGVDVGPEAVAATGAWQTANAALGQSFTHVKNSIGESTDAMSSMTALIKGTTALIIFGFEVASGVVGIYTESIWSAWEAAKALTNLDFSAFASKASDSFFGLTTGVLQLKDIVHEASLATLEFLDATSLIKLPENVFVGPQLQQGPTSVSFGPAEKAAKAAKEKEEKPIAPTFEIGLNSISELQGMVNAIPQKLISTLGGVDLVGAAVSDPLGELFKIVPLLGPIAAGIVDLGLHLDDKLEAIFGQIFALPEDLGGSIRRLLVDVLPGIISGLPSFVFDLIAVLPGAIFEGVFQGTIAIVDAVLALPVQLPKAIVNGLVGLFETVWQSIKEFFTSLFNPFSDGGILDSLWDTIKSIVPIGGREARRNAPGIDSRDLDLANLRGFASGGFVDRTGLALVHEGERIVPSSGANTGSAGGLGGISIGNITVQANDPREFVRQLRAMLGDQGLGETLAAF